MGHQRKLGSYGKNRIFGPKPRFRAQKKTFTSGWTPCSGHDQKKVPFSKINVSLLRNFGFFFGYNAFLPNNHFSAELTGFFVILGHLFMARAVPPSFVENSSKLRVLIIAKWEWPETAKFRGEPQNLFLAVT